MKLIKVDDIKWQKGVFVNPITDEPLPIIHKMATIEMLRDWQEEVKAIPLDKVEQAREEVQELLYDEIITDNTTGEPTELTEKGEGLNMALDIIYKLTESEEEK